MKHFKSNLGVPEDPKGVGVAKAFPPLVREDGPRALVHLLDADHVAQVLQLPEACEHVLGELAPLRRHGQLVLGSHVPGGQDELR